MERQVKLNFEPNKHVYSDETGKIYTSVTTVIGKYKEPFNRRYWGMYTALRDSGFKVRPTNDKKCIVVNGKYRTLDSLYSNPINTHEVGIMLDKWKVLTEAACERGNNTHDYLENSINKSKDDDDGSSNTQIEPQLAKTMQGAGLVKLRTKHDLDITNLEEVFPVIYKRLLDYINAGCILYAEKKVYTVQYGIAGMIDVLIVKGNQFAILDWKTNKDEMLFKSGYYKKVKINNEWIKSTNWIDRKSYLLPPLTDIEDCKGMIYSLQLSLYAFIMELWGYTLVPDGLEIFHIRPNLTPKLIKIRYLKNKVKALVTHHKKIKTQNKKQTTNLFGIK